MTEIKMIYGKGICRAIGSRGRECPVEVEMGWNNAFTWDCCECEWYENSNHIENGMRCLDDTCKHRDIVWGYQLSKQVKDFQYEPCDPGDVYNSTQPWLKIGRTSYGEGTNKPIEKLWINGELVYSDED